jgi:diguanylate cyclase (GGDEF)-like protein
MAFIYLDIDDFKHINDTIGHAFGDDFIVMIADFFEDEVDGFGQVSRLGGDEFGIVIYSNFALR